MIKKIILTIFLPFTLIAQDSNHTVNWKSNFLFESNGLNKNFLNSFLYGGHITDSVKNKWLNSSNKDNIINSEIINELRYTFRFKKQRIEFSIADMNIINSSFTDDLLHLLFEGNFQNQDKTLDFSNTNIRADRYQQYKIRYGTTINNINIDGGVSYIAGNHHLSYIIEEGSVYTAPFGTYLDIEYDMNAYITDTSNLSLFANNGNGIAIDFSTDFQIKKHNIHLSLENLGFIMWNTSSIKIATDSTYNFQGIEVEDIYNFNDSLFQANNIMDDVIQTNTDAFKSYIPSSLHLSFSGATKYKYLTTYTAGFFAKWQPLMDNTPLSFAKINQGFKESNFSPLYYIHSIFKAKYCNVIPRISHGGYSNDTNIGLALSKGKKKKIIIGTQHLEDIFKSEDATAVSIYLRLQIQF